MARELLARLGEVSPRERFADMVRMGLINREGELTKDFGGEADPEERDASETR